MPTLNWIGKEKVVNHHLDVPYLTLDRQYSYDENGRHENDNGSENMIIHGDNLTALKSLLPRYEGRIKCIYIDPPYNTGNEKWVYNDNVNSPIIKKWIGEVVGAEGEDLSRHDKWLCMMYPRLRLLHKLLADDGVIFISIDDNEQANLKLLCDEIFGANNCIGPIIQNKLNAKNDTIDIQKNHEFILTYRKNTRFYDGRIIPTLTDKQIKYRDVFEENGEYYYINDAITTRGEGGTLSARPNLGYTVYYNPTTNDKIAVHDYDFELLAETEDIYTDDKTLIDKGYIPIRPPKVRNQLGVWTWSLEKFNENSRNIVITGKKGNYAVKKRTFVNSDDVVCVNGKNQYISEITTNCKSIMEYSTNEGSIVLRSILDKPNAFSNPKNLSMIKYLISLICDKNAIVLDSFAGSGTTAHAVLDMNKADGGNRKFILIEMEDYADTITAERVKRVIDGYGDSKKAVDGTGGNFSFYELGQPILKDDLLNEDVDTQKIREYIFYTETKQIPTSKDNEPFFLGEYESTAYYFIYEKNAVTSLDRDFLKTIQTKSERYVIYADKCPLSDETLKKCHITFRKIPRDITRI